MRSRRAKKLRGSVSRHLLSQAGQDDRGERKPGERVLEEVLQPAVVEEVLRLEVEPHGAGDARAGSGIDEQLRRQEGRIELVARYRGGEIRLRVVLGAVGTAGDA